jgi:hypothetical protein
MGGGPAAWRVALNTNLIDDRKECAMKLTSEQVERTLTQFQGEAIPDNHPVIPQLNGLFGEHTFFLDSHGLNVVEPAEAAGSDAQLAKVVNDWSTSSSVITTSAHWSSITIINSRRSSQLAPRSSVKCASSVTRLTSTPSCGQ